MKVTADIGLVEDITDILTKEGIKSGTFKKGQLLKFDCDGTLTYIKIIKLNKRKGTAVGKHTTTADVKTAQGHYGHNIDSTREIINEYGCPYCTDCEMPISDTAKVIDDNHLSDGTEIK